MVKRFRALVFALIYLFSTFYSQQSHAFLPFLAAGGLVSAGAGAGAVDLLAGAVGLAAGVGLGIKLLDIQGEDKDGNPGGVRVPLPTTGPDTAVPPPVVPSSIPQIIPAASQACIAMAAGPVCGTPESACQDYVTKNWPNGQVWYLSAFWSAQSNSGTCLMYNGSNNLTMPMYSSVQCPAGYSGSNSCNLTDPRPVVDDKKKDVKRAGTAYSPYAGDKGGSLTPVYSTTTNPNDTVTVSGVAGSASSGGGGAFSLSAQAMSNGGTVITAQAQKIDASGQTYVEKRVITVDASGTVTGVQSGSQGGSMNYNATTQKYDVTTNSVTLNIPASGSGSTAGTGAGTGSTTVVNTTTPAPSITFPSDYAKQGEAASAAQTVKAAVDSLTQKTPPPAIPASKNSSDFSNNFETPLTQTFQGLGLAGWRVPAHASTCPVYPIKVSFSGKEWINTTLNVHCQLFDTFRDVFSNFMVVAYVLVAFFILMGA